MCAFEHGSETEQPSSTRSQLQSCPFDAAHEGRQAETAWPFTTSRQHEVPGPQLLASRQASAALPGVGPGPTMGHVVPVAEHE